MRTEEKLHVRPWEWGPTPEEREGERRRRYQLANVARALNALATVGSDQARGYAFELPSTPSSELLSTMVASVAQYERRLIGQRTREALAVKRAQGVRLGRPPVVTDATVQRIRRLRRSGRSFAAIAAALNAKGVPSPLGGQWHRASARRIALAE